METEICPICPWGREVSEPIIYKLMQYMALMDAGCPVEKNDLLIWEWQLIGVIKTEQQKITAEEAKKRQGSRSKV